MEDTITIHNRYGETHTLRKLRHKDSDKESKTYAVHSNGPIKLGYSENNTKFLELSGGPTISVGKHLKDTDAVVKYIDSVFGFGYVVTFE